MLEKKKKGGGGGGGGQKKVKTGDCSFNQCYIIR